MLTLDHLAVSAATLEDGVAMVEDRLGVRLAPGGQHPAMGTHNRLMALAPGLYLEVIAIDPDAAPPGRPRWFDLDRFAGPPRLTNWIARCDDLSAALADAPAGCGQPMSLARADLRWQMAVPADGRLPFDGLFPALMAWQGTLHPAALLPETGCRLVGLELYHPQAEALRAALQGRLNDPLVAVHPGDRPELRALIDTPAGRRVLE
ncbi:VOC family protein [Rhodovulum adriaticum]|uniref:Glyoxalase-like protein n=1 Tax=Rhodovulum adriaticum TaxID=35804 RepID=A0A4R2NW49_RHOAD|nr:VOC family protein [Rhodovulum adriaticum]MBK1635244.1 polyphosphate kinase [Rhodovulum adriaticum]TCP26379.1 glyoxalase-like protein [Rhodovulum adriaticum]